jgi:hypothetical protein
MAAVARLCNWVAVCWASTPELKPYDKAAKHSKRSGLGGDIFMDTSLCKKNQSVIGNISKKEKRHHGVYPVMALVRLIKTIAY